ncbi:hypothetical protein [Sphingobacterium sp.]|uniref:hypothetical protein n=1 Tax=Sphingobacterium sp. TaxID=341027 RepID=UPI0031DF08A4
MPAASPYITGLLALSGVIPLALPLLSAAGPAPTRQRRSRSGPMLTGLFWPYRTPFAATVPRRSPGNPLRDPVSQKQSPKGTAS